MNTWSFVCWRGSIFEQFQTKQRKVFTIYKMKRNIVFIHGLGEETHFIHVRINFFFLCSNLIDKSKNLSMMKHCWYEYIWSVMIVYQYLIITFCLIHFLSDWPYLFNQSWTKSSLSFVPVILSTSLATAVLVCGNEDDEDEDKLSGAGFYIWTAGCGESIIDAKRCLRSICSSDAIWKRTSLI